MAKYSRLYVLTNLIETGLVPLFYQPDAEVAIQIAEACAAGGASCVEYTNRGDCAHLVFEELSEHFVGRKGVILGVGSIADPGTASLYIQLGANFIVGPMLNTEVARVCNRRKVAYIPGCGSVTEISEAEELGAEICKIFPARQLGGPSFVKAVLAPLPWARLMPTGGVDANEENISRWFEAGVSCVGMGSKLVTKELVAARNYEGITDRVRMVLKWIQKIRKDNPPII